MQRNESIGSYDEGAPIVDQPDQTTGDTERTISTGMSAGDASGTLTVGDNDDVYGDADAMTAGSTGAPAPDDQAMRNVGKATDSGDDYVPGGKEEQPI